MKTLLATAYHLNKKNKTILNANFQLSEQPERNNVTELLFSGVKKRIKL